MDVPSRQVRTVIRSAIPKPASFPIPFRPMTARFRPPVGEAYARVESPRGELGFYLVSDGSSVPYRFKIRAPSYINLSVLNDLAVGHTVADAIVILGSIDIVVGEVDR